MTNSIFNTESNILVKDNKNPINGKKFSEMLLVEAVKDGFKVTINPGASDPNPVRTDRSDKAMYSLMDMFGLCVYSKLMKDYHERHFDVTEPFVQDIAARKINGVWQKLSWKDNMYRVSDKFNNDDHQENFSEKHTEMNVIIQTIILDRPYVFYVWGKQADNFKRIVLERMDLTVAVAKEAKNIDWGMAKNAELVRGEAKATPSVVHGESVVIYDSTTKKNVDLASVVDQYVEVLFTNKSTKQTYVRPLNPQRFDDLTQIKACLDENSKFTAEVQAYLPMSK